MKKSLLLAAAALFVSAQTFALDMYVVGADVDGQSWALGTNKMTQTGDGTYEWTGSKLGNMFKINDGTWNATYNIGMGDDGSISIDTPYHYYMGDGSGDITFNGFDEVTNPKIVLDMNKGTIVLSGTPGEKEPVDPSNVTFYIIGADVNGQSWTLAQPDAAFTDEGNGIYRWKGNVLGTGFKINDGTWSNGDFNIGSAGTDIEMGSPYYYWANGSSGNIAFKGFTILNDPEIELNLNDETITIVGGTPDGEALWYVAGINGVYELTPDWQLTEVSDGVYEREVTIFEITGKFKISDTGWAHQFGTNDETAVGITPTDLSFMFEEVSGEGGDIPYELEEGTYKVSVDLNEYIVTFSSATDGSVEDIVVAGQEKAAQYFNLMGAKVVNPDKGIFIQVVNGKATKIVK